MQTLRDIAPYLALAAALAVVVLGALAVWLWLGLRRVRHGQIVVMGPHGERDLVTHAEIIDAHVHGLSTAVEALGERLNAYKSDLDGAFTNRAVVRYDAFRESGGEQSASIALLDRHRSGVVISTIHSRDSARIYVKQLREGFPDRALSPEEIDVVELAMAGAAAKPAAAADRPAPPAAPDRP